MDAFCKPTERSQGFDRRGQEPFNLSYLSSLPPFVGKSLISALLIAFRIDIGSSFAFRSASQTDIRHPRFPGPGYSVRNSRTTPIASDAHFRKASSCQYFTSSANVAASG